MSFRRPLAAFVAAIALTSAPLFAQSDADKATARELAVEGESALNKKDFKTAADRFTRAESLFHAPTLVLGMARSNAGLGKLVEAQEQYNRVIHETLPSPAPPAFTRAQQDAGKELKSLEGRIPWVILTVDGPSAKDAHVTIDDIDFPAAALGVKRALNPGSHVAKAVASGSSGEKQFDVKEGATASVTVTMESHPGVEPPPVVVPPPTTTTSAPTATPSATAAPTTTTPPAKKGSALKIVGFTMVGLGVVGLGIGGVTGGLAIGKRSGLVDACDFNQKCPVNQSDNVDQYHTLTKISTIGVIAGAAAAATGIVLLIIAPKSSSSDTKKASVTPFIGPSAAGVTGRF